MDRPIQTNEQDHTAQTDNQNVTAQPGAAWVDKPVKVDGLTDAEAFTKKQMSSNTE